MSEKGIIVSNNDTEVTREQSTPHFPKNEHFLLFDTHMYLCISECKKCSFFWKIWRALKICYLRVVIRVFVLLLTQLYLDASSK